MRTVHNPGNTLPRANFCDFKHFLMSGAQPRSWIPLTIGMPLRLFKPNKNDIFQTADDGNFVVINREEKQ